jgi:peptide/nickel transport system substrate-binding protein
VQMRVLTFAGRRGMALAAVLLALADPAAAEPRHGIAMYGEPALPPDFVSLPYADPDAPKGGRIVQGEVGSFDSLNPHILKGNVPWQLRFLAYESLMGRSYDEPFTLYGLLAESVETDEARSWVEFTIRPEARFSDGSPVTVEDVLWSYETLGTLGHPRYHTAWAKVASAEATGPRSVRFTFTEADREMPLLMGLRPILKKAQWEGVDFAESGTSVIPITTAPYQIESFEPGRHVTLRRDPDYWGKDLPFMRGQANLDEIRMEFFGDGTVMFEAFTSGLLTAFRESNATKWAQSYDFPAVTRGDVMKSAIPHERPSGITGLVMNTRRDLFADWRVREAMLHAFNFEFINQTLNAGQGERITSYFSNSVLAMEPGPAEGRERELLETYAADLLPGALEGYALPVADGTERNRGNIARAMELMAEAGWTVQNGLMKDEGGRPFTFDILLTQGASEPQQIVDIFAGALGRLGITPTVTTVDSAQFTERTNAFDFDMTWYTRGLSLSPGNEQLLYWGSAAADEPGSRNWMGAQSPAIDGLVQTMLTVESGEDFLAATRALDRVLTTGRYVIPVWHNPISYIAHRKELKYPADLPIYGDFIGWMPDVWWYEE